MLTTRKLASAVAFLGAIALAAGAVPAFTADTGSVTASVSVPTPVPCLTVSPGNVDFGTLPFTTGGPGSYQPSSAERDITFTNCGTAGQNLFGATSDATGPGGSWTVGVPCSAPNRFLLAIGGDPDPVLFLNGTPAPLLESYTGPPAVFPAGGSHGSQLTLTMPCQGSNGAGETKTLTVTLTAAVA